MCSPASMKDAKYNPWSGVKTTYWINDDSFIVKKTFDAEPYLRAAAEERAVTRGEKWGETRKIASIPPAMYGQLIRDGIAFDEKRMTQWLKEHPDLVVFEKALL